MAHATRALQSHDLSGERINSGSHILHTFWTTQGHGGPPRMRDKLNFGATSERKQTSKTTHTIHARIHFNKANMKGWLWWQNYIRGVGLKLPDICLTGEEKPRKNYTQETCSDGDRTRARCMTSAHSTTCSTTVDERRERKRKERREMYFGFKGASTSKVIGARNETMMDDYDGQMIFGDLGA